MHPDTTGSLGRLRGWQPRLGLAEAAGLGGGSLWALGYEDEEVWNGLTEVGPPRSVTFGAWLSVSWPETLPLT